MEITKVIGTVAMVPKGEYNLEENYEYLNVISYDGSSYIAKRASKGVPPTNTEYWQLCSRKGDTGEVSLVNVENMLNMGARTINITGNSYQDKTNLAPDNPQNIEIITGDVQFVGKNIFDKNTMAARIYAYLMENLTTWAVAAGGYSIRIPCEPNTNYTVSANNPNETIFRAGVTDSDSIPASSSTIQVYSVSRHTNTNESINITTSANAKYIVVQVGVETASDTFNTLQVEKGPEATVYEEYKSVTIPLSTSELAKVGNISDKLNIDLDTGIISKVNNVGKYIYNNDLILNSQSDTAFSFLTPSLNVKKSLSSSSFTNISLCNMMQTSVVDGNGLNGTTSANRIRVIISKSIVATQEEALEIFSTNNLTIYYMLEAPTRTQIAAISQPDINILKSIPVKELNVFANLDTTLSSTTYLDTLIEYLRTQFQSIS